MPPPAAAPADPVAPARRRWFWQRRAAAGVPGLLPVEHALPRPAASLDVADRAPPVTDGEVAAAAAAMESLAAEHTPALVELATRLALSDFERDTLLLAAGTELDPDVATLCAEAGGGPGGRYPTFGLALRPRAGARPRFVDSREAWTGLDRAALVLEVGNPSPSEQEAAWADALPAGPPRLAADLAANFDLDPVTIRQLGVTGADELDAEASGTALWRSVLTSTRPGLDLLGRFAEPKVRAADLVLPDQVMDQIARIEEQVRHRSTVYHRWGMSSG